MPLDRTAARNFCDRPMANNRTSEGALSEAMEHLDDALVEVAALDRQLEAVRAELADVKEARRQLAATMIVGHG